jgi:hypothetical protein
MRGFPCCITPDFADSHMSNVLKHILPFGLAGKVLGKDIRAHVVGPTMDKFDLLTDHGFVEESDIDPMCSRHVPHRGVFTQRDDSNSSGVILHEFDGQFLVT